MSKSGKRRVKNDIELGNGSILIKERYLPVSVCGNVGNVGSVGNG